MIEKIKQIAAITEDVTKIIKACTLIATILGTYYFLSYTISEGLPFPLDLTVLPIALLVIGASSIAITVLIIIYILMAAFVHLDTFNINYPLAINTNSRGIFAPSIKVILCNWFLIYGAPVGIWLILLFQKALPEDAYVKYLSVGYMIWGILYGIAKAQAECYRKSSDFSIFYQVKAFKKEDFIYAFKISLTTFFASFFGLFSSVLLLLGLSARGLLENKAQFIIASIFFVGLNFGVLAAYFRPKTVTEFNEGTEGKIVLNIEVLKGKLFKSPVTILFGTMLAMTVLPNIAPYIGELPLRFLNIGGGIKRSFTVSSKVAENLPEAIIEGCDKNGTRCTLKVLVILLDLGQTMYVKTTENMPTFVYRISRIGLDDIIIHKK